jgi:hypothetical protein
MDSTLNIHAMGKNILHVFPEETRLIGRPLDQVFRLIRPDILVEWDKVCDDYSLFKYCHLLLRFFPMVDILCF